MLLNWLKKLHTTASHSRRAAQPQRRTVLTLETLEGRVTPSTIVADGAPTGTVDGYSLQGGDLFEMRSSMASIEVASDVSSMAQGPNNTVYYLREGDLYQIGRTGPLATSVTAFVPSTTPGLVYLLKQNGSLDSLNTSTNQLSCIVAANVRAIGKDASGNLLIVGGNYGAYMMPAGSNGPNNVKAVQKSDLSDFANSMNDICATGSDGYTSCIPANSLKSPTLTPTPTPPGQVQSAADLGQQMGTPIPTPTPTPTDPGTPGGLSNPSQTGDIGIPDDSGGGGSSD